jgi:hypothetical protein
MAEVVGLVIGGISLVTLVDSASSAFDKLEAEKNYGKDYRRVAFQVSLLRLRLTRWTQAMKVTSKGASIGTEAQGKEVQELLTYIEEDIDGTEKYAKRYRLKDEPVPTEDAEDLAMKKLIAKAQKLSLHRQKNTNIMLKTRWALRDQKNFTQLAKQIEENIVRLEDIFPVQDQRNQLASTEVKELIKPDEIEEPGENVDGERTVKVLSEAAKDVDTVLNEAIMNTLPQDVKNHIFSGEWNTSAGSEIHVGDKVASGYIGPKGDKGIYSGKFNTTGGSKAQYGNDLGGQGMFGSAGVFGPGGLYGDDPTDVSFTNGHYRFRADSS